MARWGAVYYARMGSDELATPEFTPRQREVLDLLSQGLTNGEIADRLGISLDGAKWHVSEVMSKLGVSSREAAAAYWRREQRPVARLRRLPQRLAGTPLLKWAAAGTAAAILGAAVLVAVLALGDREPETSLPDAGDSSPTAGASTATVSASATAGPSPTVTSEPTEAPVAEYEGEPVYELRLADPVELPADSVLYVTVNCGVCIDRPLYRFYQSAGEWVLERLMTDETLPNGYPLSMISDGNGRWAASWCLTDAGTCGKRHDGTPDTTPRALVISEDGGISGRQVATLGTFVTPIAFRGDEVVVSERVSDDQTVLTSYPSGARLDPDDLGSIYAVPLPGGATLTHDFLQPAPDLANDTTTVLTIAAPSGARDLVAFLGGHLRIDAVISDTMVLGWAIRNSKALDRPDSEVNGQAVLVDLDARTVAPIAHLTGFTEMDFVTPVGFAHGPFLKVTGSDTCLYVRREPGTNAEPIGCFADLVLLADRQERQQRDGMEWAAVRTPRGEDGWAAVDYLVPLGGPD